MTKRRWLGPPADTTITPPPNPGPALEPNLQPSPTAPRANESIAARERPVTPPAALERPVAAAGATTAEPERHGPWQHWGRWLMLALCVLAGALFAWDPDLWEGYPIGVGMTVGALGALVTVHVYGLLAWIFMRGLLRRRAWSYQRVTYSPLILSLVLVGMFGMSALRASEDPDATPSGAELRREIDDAADDVVAAAPDPVGKKLAGQSAQLSDGDLEALSKRAPVGVRFGTMLARVLKDYNDPSLSAQQWIASSRKRLAHADKALSALRKQTATILDEPVAAQLRRFDRRRAQTLTAFNRLLGVVAGQRSGSEVAAQDVVNRRLRAYQRESRRLADLMAPYMSDEQLKLFDRGGGA